MFRSLHMKLVLIMLLLITSLMAIVGAFLMTSITSFYIDEFYQQMESVFGDSSPSSGAFVSSLRQEASQTDSTQAGIAQQLQNMIEAKAGDLGLNSQSRNYYVLDGHTGQYLTGSADQESFSRLQTTPNLLTARNSIAEGTDVVGDSSDITARYMDVAIPITGEGGAFIIYIYDNRETVSELNSQLFLIIVQALLVGLLISVLLSFLLSKTMITPIERLTEGAERVAAGDFSNTITVESTDEIGILTTTFNDMAAVLQDTLEAVENERNKLDTLFLHMTDGVVAFASDGSVLHSNPAVSQMLGKEVNFYDYDALFGQQFPFDQVMSLQRPDFVSGELTAGGRILELYLAPFSDGADGGERGRFDLGGGSLVSVSQDGANAALLLENGQVCTAVLLDKDLNVQYSGNVPAANQILRRGQNFYLLTDSGVECFATDGVYQWGQELSVRPQALIAGKQLLVLCGNTVQQIAPPEQTASSAR